MSISHAPARADVSLNAGRLERLARAVLIAFVVAFAVTLLTGSDSSTSAGRIGGDYPAFYGAGSIVLHGDADHLYEPERQAQAERDLFGHEQGGFLYFAYPPFVAAMYAPLAALPYRASYALHTLLMAGALILALRLLRPMVPILGRRFWVSSVLALAFFPMFRAVGGGQNTAFTVLLIALAWRAAHDDRQVLCGTAIGLLLFKPQLAALFLVLLVITRRWKAVATSAGIAAVLWTAGAVIQGPGWVGPYLDHANWFSAVDARVNADNAVSLLGAVHAAFGEHALWASAIAGALSLLVVLLVLRTWWHADPHRLAAPMAVACAGAVLATPHVMFYDAGLLIITGVAILAVDDRRARAVLIALGAAGAAHVLTGVTPFNPLVLVSAAAFVLALAVADADVRRLPPRPRPPADDGTSRPDLSIVIPAYNEAARLRPTLESIETYVADSPRAIEVLVVDDGSTDDTAHIAASFEALAPTVVRLPHNQGKGAAVRTGMLQARGRWRLFMDADSSTPVEYVDVLLRKALDDDLDVVVGSIAVEGGEMATRQSVGRMVLGMLGSLFIRLTVLPGIRDTQRGFKLFAGHAADDVFSQASATGWGFDVEVLALARAAGYPIGEVGVRWEHRDGGTLRPHAYVDTLREVWRIRTHQRHDTRDEATVLA